MVPAKVEAADLRPVARDRNGIDGQCFALPRLFCLHLGANFITEMHCARAVARR
jgi:hypothetical protein